MGQIVAAQSTPRPAPTGGGASRTSRPAGGYRPVAKQITQLAGELRYYQNLISEAFHHACDPEFVPQSFRSERLSLGIDFPELDTVPLWSTRRADGTISIAFIEFLLGRIQGCLDPLIEANPRSRAADLRDAHETLGVLLEMADPAAECRPSLPRLSDVFLPQVLLARLTGPQGLLDRVVQHSSELAAEVA